MTEPPKLPDIVEHLREAIREGAGQLAENCIEEITRLRARLEMDGVWQLIDGKMQRISVEPGSIPDGIECRDETIKLQDAEIARLRLRSPAPAEDGEKLWLWRDGKDRFLAFRSLFPLMPDGGDPATIGQPSGYAFYHPMTLAEAQKVSREADRAEDGEGLREALKQIALITASGRTTELLAKMAQVNALARAALSSGRDGRKT